MFQNSADVDSRRFGTLADFAAGWMVIALVPAQARIMHVRFGTKGAGEGGGEWNSRRIGGITFHL